MITPYILGITGRVGAGKSTAVQLIQSITICTVFDLDEIGHQLLDDSGIQIELRQIFGASIFENFQKISRKKLGDIVFNDAEELKKLNAVLHPEIKQVVEDRIHQSRLNDFTIIVGALLDEIGLRQLCSSMLVIDADDADIQAHIPDKFIRISPFQRSRQAYRQSADWYIQNHFDDQFHQSIADALQKIQTHRSKIHIPIAEVDPRTG